MTINHWKYKIMKFLSFDSKDKISIFINKREDLNKIAPILKAISKDKRVNFRLTSFGVELPSYFQDLNIEIDYSSDYLNEEDCLYIDDFFFKKLRKTWFVFKNFPQEYFNENKKTLLGRCNEYNFMFSNLELVKYIEVMRKIFTIYKPTRILIIEDTPYLTNIVKLFSEKYKFEYIRVGPELTAVLNRLKRIRKTIKAFLIDLAILLLDFFVLHYVFISRRFKNKIIIDHRLYEKFAHTKLKEQFFICLFEKGLKIRLQMLSKRLLYLPMRTISSFGFFYQGNKIFEAIENWRKIRRRTDVRNIFKYKDIIFWDAIEGYLSETFLVTFPRIMANMSILQKLARKKKVRLIVMRNDIKELERTLIEAARPLKIPSLVIQHGMIGHINVDDTLYADMTAVWGRNCIDWFREFGYKDDKFTVTGSPIYDEFYLRNSANHRDIVRKRVCQDLSLTFTKKIITFLTSSNHSFYTSFVQTNEMATIIESILKTIQPLPDIQLIIKIHPHDKNLNIYSKVIKNFSPKPNIAMVRDFNTFDILEASDLVMMMDSSSGLEALILDKPLIALKMNKFATVIPFAEAGVAIRAGNSQEIELAIKDGLYNEKTRENLRLNRNGFIFDHAYKIDGQATKRVEELIYNFLK